METQAYKLLKAAPMKIAAVVGAIAAIATAIWADEIKAFLGVSWTNGQVTNWIAYFFAATTIYCAAGWWLKPTGITTDVSDKEKLPASMTSMRSHIDAMATRSDELIEAEAVTPDLDLNGLLAQVYKALNGAPDGTDQEKAAFYKKVDREIGDKVHLRKMAIWGRINDRPLQQLRSTQSIVLDHKKKCLFIHSDALYPTRYTDLRFNKAQVRAAWPLK